MPKVKHAVTGAFGYSGKYIATRLLEQGHEVITLTNSLQRLNPFAGRIKAYPFNFDKPDELTESLRGVSVLYNTYWVRFNHKLFHHAGAVRNSMILFSAAKAAGVERIVHISITNPFQDSHLEYFSSKAIIEEELIESGISYAILRPAALFGKEDILINNIAWTLRKLPMFGLFGRGEYRLQPIYVDDLAALAVEYGAHRENDIVNAIGPETFTFKQLVKTIAQKIGVRRLIVPFPPLLAFAGGWLIGKLRGDIMITRAEIEGLMANLLYVDSPPTGKTKLSDWLAENSQTVGRKYTSELARRIDLTSPYQSN